MTKTLIAVAVLTATPFSAVNAAEDAEVFANLRSGIISSEDADGDNTSATAIGGKLGFISPQKSGFRAGATLYTTQKLSHDDNNEFFDSKGSGYTILGEAYIQFEFPYHQIKVGRFLFDSPHADTDDIRMIPNTFQGAMLTNTSFAHTEVTLAWLDRWSGVGADRPEDFNRINDDEGLFVAGVANESIENLGLQAWYYYADDLASWFYTEALYETDAFTLGAQFGSQDDETADNSGNDGDVWGLLASVNIADLTFSATYNRVSGTVINGLGGGPYFTSADDHTIEGVEDEKAFGLGVEYSGIDQLTLAVYHLDLDQQENEWNFVAGYELNDALSFEFVHLDMSDDGKSSRLIMNYSFDI